MVFGLEENKQRLSQAALLVDLIERSAAWGMRGFLLKISMESQPGHEPGCHGIILGLILNLAFCIHGLHGSARQERLFVLRFVFGRLLIQG